MSLMLAVLFLQIGGPPPEENPSAFGILIRATAVADLRAGLSTLEADSLTAFPSASYRDRMFNLEATAAVEHDADSGEAAFRPVSAGAFVRWPGSPWLSAGVFRGLRDPFVFGLSDPLYEWKSAGVSELDGVSAEAGGVLGFDGWWNQYGDTLSWYGVKSPWLGFGQVSWESMETDTSTVGMIRGFAGLKVVQPWFNFVKEDDSWSGEGEIRGWKPIRTPRMSLEIVPAACWCTDSTVVGLSGYLRGRTMSFSGFLSVMANPDEPGEATLKAGYDMLSQAGVQWSLEASLEEMEDFSGSVSGICRAAPAGCGGSVCFEDDSLAVTAIALYSPVPGVSSVLSVSSDLSTGSPDPRGSLGVFAAGSAGTAGFTLHWEEGSTVLGLGVSAWID